MRMIDCPCGQRLEGADDEELFGLAHDHIAREHAERQRADEQVPRDAYDLVRG